MCAKLEAITHKCTILLYHIAALLIDSRKSKLLREEKFGFEGLIYFFLKQRIEPLNSVQIKYHTLRKLTIDSHGAMINNQTDCHRNYIKFDIICNDSLLVAKTLYIIQYN